MNRALSLSEHFKISNESVNSEIDYPVEQDFIALDETIEGIEDACQEMGSLDESIDSLEHLIEDLSLKSDQLTLQAFKYAKVAINTVTAYWDLDKPLVSSMESGLDLENINQEIISLESTTGYILKNLIAFIKSSAEFVLSLITKFFKFIMSIMDSMTLESKMMYKKAGKINKEPANKKIDITRYANRISIRGELPANIADSIKTSNKSFLGLINNYNVKSAMLMESASFNALLTSDDSNFDQLFQKAEAEVQKSMETTNKLFISKIDNLDVPGYISVECSINDKGTTQLKMEKDKSERGKVDINTLTPSEIKNVAQLTKDFSGNENKVRNQYSKAVKQRNDSIRKQLESSSLSKENIRKLSGLVRKATNNGVKIDHAALTILSAYTKSIYASFKIAEKSLKLYK